MKEETQEKLLLICGKEEKEIRKAFFSGKEKLLKFMDSIQAEEKYSEAEVKRLGEFMSGLKKNNEDFITQVQKTFGGSIIGEEKAIDPPTIEDVKKNIADDGEWRERANKSLAFVNATFKQIEDAIRGGKNLSPDYWLKLSSLMLPVEQIIFQDYVYRKQIYHALVVEFINRLGCSWSEAEARAKATHAYTDYKNLQKLVGDQNQQGLLNRLEMLNKRMDNKN